MAAGLLVAVFAAGLIVGGVGSGAIEEREQTEQRPERRPYIETLQDTLDLSADQRQQIENILSEWRTTYRATTRELQQEERRRIQEIRIDARAKIAAALDSSQADRYREMLAHGDSVQAARAERRR
jgi:hypothetical protein